MLVRKLIELLAPVSCVECGREGDALCVACWGVHATTPLPACFRCERLTPAGQTCSICRPNSSLARVTVAAVYRGPIKEVIRQLKFKRGRHAAAWAAGRIAAQFPAPPQIHAVTAVPIPPARYRERGYNQSELIARELARLLNVPYLQTLERLGSGHQVGHGRSERLQAVQGSFFPTRRLDGARLLVVDDVLTTGATLNECASVLRSVGALYVEAATIARR